jgi:hypothetical protein
MAIKDCPHCGLVNPPEALRCDCGYDFVVRRVEQPYARPDPASPADTLRVVGRFVRLIKFIAGGIACLALGIWLLTNPMFRANPKQLGFSDALPGVGAIVAGLGMFGLVALALWKRK